MKKLAFLVVALSTVFVACKKESDDPAEKTTREKIIALWAGDKIEISIEVPGMPPQQDVEDFSYATVNFKSDGTVEVDSAGVNIDNSTWSIDNNDNFMLDGEVFNIYTLTESNFDFGFVETDTINEMPLVIATYASKIKLVK